MIENAELILRARELHRIYKMGRNKVHVLKGVDLDVNKGQIVAVVGASGVGKSTLLHLLGALDRPTNGTVEINGQDISALDESALAEFRNQTIGFVFQFHHLLPEFTAIENVMLPAMIAGKKPDGLRGRAEVLLDDVGLGHRANHRPGELSGGEMQRVAVARSLMNDPMLVLADEPSGNLDQKSSRALHDLLWDLSRKDERTFILVTHNQELAENADKIIEMFDGRIAKEHVNQIV